MQEVGLLLPNTVLCTNAASHLAHVVHDEGLDHALGALLQALIFIPRQHNVEMEVTIADVAMTVRQDLALLGICEFRALSDEFSRGLNYMMVVCGRQTNVVLECVSILDCGIGDTLAQVPQLMQLFFILRNDAIDDLIFNRFEEIEKAVCFHFNSIV